MATNIETRGSNPVPVLTRPQMFIPLFFGMMTFVLVMAATWAIVSNEGIAYRDVQRSQVLDRLSSVRARMETVLNARLHLVNGLAALVLSGDEISEEQFQIYAHNLAAGQKDIRSLQLAPNAVIVYVYPREGNQEAIGHDLLADPRRREAVERSIRERTFNIAGPVNLLQGGVAAIGRKPIFQGEGDNQKFWGFATILIDLEPLLDAGGVFEQQKNLNIALRGKDGLGDKGATFYGEPSVFNQSPVILDITLPNGFWQIAALPINGWSENAPIAPILWLSGFLLSVALGGLMTVLVRSPIQLKLAVDKAVADHMESESRFRGAFEEAAHGIALAELDGRFLRVNRAFCRIIGYSEEELLTRNDLDVTHPDDIVAGYGGVQGAVTAKGGSFQQEIRFVHKNNDVIWVLISAALVRDSRGEPLHIVLQILDFTARRVAEERVRQTVDELTRSNTELERFAYIASHDLQEPIRTVVSYVQMLQRRYKGKLDAEADEFIHYAVDGAKRMSTLINGLLDLAGARSKDFPFSEIDLEDITSSVLDGLKVAIDESNAKIDVGALPTIAGDEMQMVQLLQNLVGNAIKFRAPNTPVEVSISSESVGAYWRVCVRDNGIGISEEYRDAVFNIFRRLHTIESYPGSGVGLAICKVIVERHGGKMWVDANPSGGSEFCFTVPKTDADLSGQIPSESQLEDA